MIYYKAIGFVKQKNKNVWDKFNNNAIFACPEDENPYIYLTKNYSQIFDFWLINFQQTEQLKEDN